MNRVRRCPSCGGFKLFRLNQFTESGLLESSSCQCTICGAMVPDLVGSKPAVSHQKAQPENQGEQSGRVPLEQPAHDAAD
jgi:hypothetical protein